MIIHSRKLQFLIYLIILNCFVSIPVFSQRIEKTSGVAQVELTRDKSRAQVENEAKDKAIINAIEKAFGTVVMQGNATYISNINTGEKTETRSAFSMIANTLVKGEVVHEEEPVFTDIQGYKVVNGERIPVTEIKCEITVQAREITSPPVEFKAFPLACLNINCRKTEFKDDEDLYFYFKSPMSGYLTIFLDDADNAFRLLPYRDMPSAYECGVRVDADKEYFFFSNDKQYEYFGEGDIDRNYKLFTRKTSELNRLFVIFSKDKLNKPELVSLQQNGVMTPEEIAEGFTLPKSLRSEDFQRWLNRIRTYSEAGMQVDYFDITITGR